MIVPRGIRYVSVAPGTGYGDSAQQYIAGLRSLGVPVSWQPADGGDAGLPADTAPADICRADVDYDTVLLHLQPRDFGPWLDHRPGCVNIGYIAWEADRAPGWWSAVLDQLDLVIVPSLINQRAVRATGTSTPVAVVPHIARRVGPVPGRQFGRITDKDFVFYTMGPWYNRKALPETIRAFLEAFTADDDVALIIKTSALDYVALAAKSSPSPSRAAGHTVMSWWSLARLLAAYPRGPKLVLHSEPASAKTIDEIHTRGDCFISLTRGEGWGLGSFDAALFANPSIITGWGGHLDFLGPDYPLLVDYQLVPTTADKPDVFGFPLHDEAHWARADVSHAAAMMRRAYQSRQQTTALGAELRARLVDKYAPVVVTSELIRLIVEAHGRRGARPHAS